jgi:transposase
VRGPGVVRVLRRRLRPVPGRLPVLWDGAPIHRGHDVTALLAAAAARLAPERLPGYAPDLNPDEGIRTYPKRVALRNRVCQSLPDRGAARRQATARLRRKRPVLRAGLHQAGYHL